MRAQPEAPAPELSSASQSAQGTGKGMRSGGNRLLATLRISNARRAPRTSRSSSAIFFRPPVVMPGRLPESISSWLTQSRSVPGLAPG